MAKRIFILLLIGMVLLALLPTVGMAQERVQERDPLLYGLASFIIPGHGQYLNDEPGKALAHFIIAVAIPTVCEIVTDYSSSPATSLASSTRTMRLALLGLACP